MDVDFRQAHLEALSRTFKHNVVSDIAKGANIPYWAAEVFLEECTIIVGRNERDRA